MNFVDYEKRIDKEFGYLKVFDELKITDSLIRDVLKISVANIARHNSLSQLFAHHLTQEHETDNSLIFEKFFDLYRVEVHKLAADILSKHG